MERESILAAGYGQALSRWSEVPLTRNRILKAVEGIQARRDEDVMEIIVTLIE